MRYLSILLAGAAFVSTTSSSFACEWNKTVKAPTNMTVVETTVPPVPPTDVSIATNDLSEEAIKEMNLKAVPEVTPAK